MKKDGRLRKTCLALVVLAWIAPAQVESQTRGIWLTKEEIQQLPMTGTAWSAMKAAADKSPVTPDLGNQDELENVRTMARAMVYVRTGTISYRDKVLVTLKQVPGTEAGGRTLAVGRKLAAYLIAADLIGYRDPGFISWVSALRTKTLTGDSSSLVKKHETKFNNYGQACGWSLVVADSYLGDMVDLARRAKIFRGMLGDRTAWSFALDGFGETWWQIDPAHPMVVLPKGAMKEGRSLDGALPEELRRCCAFKYPFPCENYTWSSNEHLLGTAWALSRVPGYEDVFQWSDQALLRVMSWNYKEATCPATGNDTSQPYLVNAIYGSAFAAPSPSTPGKDWGFSDWWAKAVQPPPIPADFSATWAFNYQASPVGWLAHKTGNGDDVLGFGATPVAALQDWIQKNPGDL